jgi:hypothetical protein
MTNKHLHSGIFFLSLMLGTTQAMAANVVDCAALANRDCRKDITMKSEDVMQCVKRGWDAPITCRKDEGKSAGVRVGGSSGFNHGTVQAPQNPPGAMGAPANVSASTIQRSFGYPPWPGFPCIIAGVDLCAAGLTAFPPPDPNDLCPAKSDTAGVYGVKQPITAGTATSLPCGGALPLTITQMTLNKNPDRLVATKYGDFSLWLYEKSGTQYKLKPGPGAEGAWPLPKILCKNAPINPSTGKPDVVTVPDLTINPSTGKPIPGATKERDKTVDLTAPIAQMITYGAGETSITLRLKSREESAVPGAPTNGNMIPAYNENDPEKYLIIPIQGGVAKVPENCAEDKDHYKDVSSMKADIVIESATGEGCEGPPSFCAGVTADPAPEATCDVAVVQPKGTFNGTVCDGKTQLIVLDRPNLLYPPGTTVTTTPIEKREAVLAPTVDKNQIWMQKDTIVRFGKTSPPVTLNEGGILELKDGKTLDMQAPVTINAAAGTVTLTGGALLKAEDGSLFQKIGSGNYTPPNPVLPFTVNVKRSMNLPHGQGYMVPTQPKPYVQLPIPKP